MHMLLLKELLLLKEQIIETEKTGLWHNAPFIFCISKINGVLIKNAEDLDIVMPMHNLIEYSENYRKTTGSLWNYYRDEPNNLTFVLHADDRPTNANSTSFKYKSSLAEKTTNNENDNNNVIQDVNIAVTLKHLSNFWRTLDMSLINCEVSLTLTWSKNYRKNCV